MPASVRWLGALIVLSVMAALLSGAGLYLETRAKNQAIAETMTGGHVTAGKDAIVSYNCGACHVIGGIHQAVGTVGPALDGVATRAELAGYLPNQPDQMTRWIRHPQQVLPGNGMPEQGVTEQDARDMAAYLYTLKN
ncbi:MAG: c-type cytochrome [Acetobacteraceae bacterium]|nr:c-type cytochrome [Acetobacteraceae bacterium]